MSEIRQSNTGMGAEILRVVLIIVAIVTLAGGCALGALAVAYARGGETTGQTAGRALEYILGGMLVAAVLLAFAAILSSLSTLARTLAGRPSEMDDIRPALNRLEQSLRVLNAVQGGGGNGGAAGAAAGRAEAGRAASAGALSGNAGAIAPLLEQLRDYTLMSDAQRERFATRHWNRRRDGLTELIERDVLVGDWVTAYARLEDLQLLLPDDPRVAELREKVESEQSSRLEEELRAARSQFRRLAGIASWQQAEDLAADLQRKHPGKADAAQFADEVRREREAYERETMERLFRDIAAATERRQWRPAILALDEFIRRYPGDPRADALRLDLPMLLENAASHDRKEQEESFKDLLKRQRYQEAITVARSVIQKYPQSPTATELNKLLPRVEDLARQEAAKQAGAAAAPAAAVPTPA